MKRHTNFNLTLVTLDNAVQAIQDKAVESRSRYGLFNSHHEVYGVLYEELTEYFQGVMSGDPDPSELIDIAATALNAIIWTAITANSDIKELIDTDNKVD